MNDVDTGYRYDRRSGEWIAWCSVNGKRVSTEVCDSEPEARAWCALERVKHKK